jgi:pimeloyl-ACP methyl ester carboxylesterase
VRELAVRAHGHRLVVVDLLGFGRSDRPLDAALTAAAHAGRVCALMDDLQIDAACLVGHGMGGGVAQAVACGRSERVTRLCLIDSVAFEAWPRRAARLSRWLCGAAPLGRAIGAPLLASLAHGSLLAGYAAAETGRRSLDHYLHAFTGALGVDALVAQLRAMRDSTVTALGPQLGGIRRPTAIVWGRLDPFLDVSLGERLKEAIPGATLEVIPDARHFTPEDAPERVAAAIATLLGRR